MHHGHLEDAKEHRLRAVPGKGQRAIVLSDARNESQHSHNKKGRPGNEGRLLDVLPKAKSGTGGFGCFHGAAPVPRSRCS
ncbi:hypothetical protein D9M69_697150 [compost metagenome]